MKFKNEDELLKALEEREKDLMSVKKDVESQIENLNKVLNHNFNKSKNFRYKIDMATSDLVKSAVQLQKLSIDISSELIRTYQKALDYNLKKKKTDDEQDIFKKFDRSKIDKLRVYVSDDDDDSDNEE